MSQKAEKFSVNYLSAGDAAGVLKAALISGLRYQRLVSFDSHADLGANADVQLVFAESGNGGYSSSAVMAYRGHQLCGADAGQRGDRPG